MMNYELRDELRNKYQDLSFSNEELEQYKFLALSKIEDLENEILQINKEISDYKARFFAAADVIIDRTGC